MKAFLLAASVVVWLLLVSQAAAQTVNDDVMGRLKADAAENVLRYGNGVAGSTSENDNAWRRNYIIWSNSGGPTMAKLGIRLGQFRRSLVPFWWMILTVTALAFVMRIKTEGGVDGARGLAAYSPLTVRLMVIFMLAANPGYLYATVATLRDTLRWAASVAFTPSNGVKAGGGIDLDTVIAETRETGPEKYYIYNQVNIGLQQGFNSLAAAMFDEASPATMQIYNALARQLNAVAPSVYPSFQPFAVATFIQGGDFGPGDKFAGTYKDVSGVVLPLTSPEGAQSYQSVFGSGKPLPVGADADNEITYASDAQWLEIARSDLPRMLQFLTMFGHRPEIAAALVADPQVKVPNVSKFIGLVPDSALVASLVAAAKSQKTGNPPALRFDRNDPAAKNVAKFHASIEAKRDGVLIDAPTLSALGAGILTQVRDIASGYYATAYVSQLATHNSTPVRRHYDITYRQHDGLYASAVVPRTTESGGVPNEGGEGFWHGAAVLAGNFIRKVVLFACTFLLDIALEASVIYVWFTAPFWLLKKTEKAFSGGLNTMVTAAMIAPALTLLLTIADMAVGLVLTKIL